MGKVWFDFFIHGLFHCTAVMQDSGFYFLSKTFRLNYTYQYITTFVMVNLVFFFVFNQHPTHDVNQ